MNRRLPVLKASRVMRVLERMGFQKVRQKGAHVCFSHPDGRFTLVPRHGGEDIGRGLLRMILHEIRTTPQEFSQYL